MLAFLLPLLLQTATPAPAAPAAETCPAQVLLPPELGGWFTPGTAGEIGKGFDLPATSPETTTLAIKVSKPGQVAVTGFDIVKAGTYRVALSAPAWIDVVQGATSLTSVAHTHGPKCSGVAKIVDFTLAPGHYTLQVSGLQAPSVRVLIFPRG